MRTRPWYFGVWWLLLVVSGPWTLFNAYIGLQLAIHPAHTIDQGFAAIGWEVFLVISIPVYVLFVGLLFNFPKGGGKLPEPPVEKDSSKDW